LSNVNGFTPIDLNSYSRIGSYNWFGGDRNLIMSITVRVDVTALERARQSAGRKAYAAQIWALTQAANEIPEFRTSLNEEGVLGVWDRVSPVYITLCKRTESVSCVVTPFDENFASFHAAYLRDVAKYTTGVFVQQEIPRNTINVSTVPWISFDSLSFSSSTTGDYRPQFILGKYVRDAGKILLPLSISVSHAVCDAWPVSKYLEKLQAILDNAEKWIL
jgi:chloramphenicol O-acetyltransferase type A